MADYTVIILEEGDEISLLTTLVSAESADEAGDIALEAADKEWEERCGDETDEAHSLEVRIVFEGHCRTVL